MAERENIIKDFLTRVGWGEADISPLAGDASPRRYHRLVRGDEKAVLMDAPPGVNDVEPFVEIAEHLCGLGLAAPRIMARDVAAGLLLLEDLGDDLFARKVQDEPALEATLYRNAIDVLLHTKSSPENLAPYDRSVLEREVTLFTDWYLPALTGKRLEPELRQEFVALWHNVLEDIATTRDCLVYRDYHAENLIHLPDRDGVQNVGLLDFQDALVGHRAYDLVSLLQDARRDVPEALEADMIDYFLENSSCNRDDFLRDYAILGAQRNLKIIGIFSRLYLRDHKKIYLDLIPRVWGLVHRDLAHPILADIKSWIEHHVTDVEHFTPKTLTPSHGVILAAGLGQRMRPLTDHQPKPLVPVLGKSLIDYTLDAIEAAGIGNVAVNIHYLADQVIDHLDEHVRISDERAELLDSGGGVKKMIAGIGEEEFYVFNSDMIWQEEGELALHRLASFWNSTDMDIAMLLIRKEVATGYEGAGDFSRSPDGQLDPAGNDFVYGGVMIMKSALFDDTPDGPFSLRLLFERASSAGRLYGVVHSGTWYHVGTPDAVGTTEKLLKGN